MSLLMKALEKAAKDRGDAQQAPPEPAPVGATAAAAPGTRPLPAELTLEPLQADAPSPPPPPAAPPPSASKPTPADRERARAATVMQATAAPTTSGSRIPPVLIIGVISGVIALGLAIYFYLQITNPGLFISRPPVMPRPPAPLAQAPAPVQPPIATGTVVAPATPAPPQVAAAPVREPSPPRTQRAAPRAPASAAAASSQAARDTIRVSPGATEPQLDSRLPQAYAALQSGKLDTARQLYGDTVRNEPRNINALLGLAAVAMQENRTEEASRLYFNVLNLEPRNAYAQAGLIAMLGRADPASAEAKLKQLISREPLPSLYFTLGNLYGDQSRWAEAQQAYFQAYQLESANPDYAYNLAVGLEHVGQTKLAVGYYRRAVAQAQGKGRVGFNLAQAQDRILQLAARPE